MALLILLHFPFQNYSSILAFISYGDVYLKEKWDSSTCLLDMLVGLNEKLEKLSYPCVIVFL